MADWPYNTANWKKLRKAHLSAFPWCEGCKAMGKPHVLANTVDHVEPISEGGNPFPGHDGLRSYCPACHSAKTARGTEAGAVRSSKPRKGCDANGYPLDPSHGWSVDERRAVGFTRLDRRSCIPMGQPGPSVSSQSGETESVRGDVRNCGRRPASMAEPAEGPIESLGADPERAPRILKNQLVSESTRNGS